MIRHLSRQTQSAATLSATKTTARKLAGQWPSRNCDGQVIVVNRRSHLERTIADIATSKNAIKKISTYSYPGDLPVSNESRQRHPLSPSRQPGPWAARALMHPVDFAGQPSTLPPDGVSEPMTSHRISDCPLRSAFPLTMSPRVEQAPPVGMWIAG